MSALLEERLAEAHREIERLRAKLNKAHADALTLFDPHRAYSNREIAEKIGVTRRTLQR